MAETLLVDTDVVSYFFKGRTEAEKYRSIVEGQRLALSFMSVAELFKWAVKRNWSDRSIGRLEGTLKRYVVIPYDRDLAWAWATIVSDCESNGRPISSSDAWIAAAATRYDIPLLTNNIRHFQPAERFSGLRLVRVSA